MIGAVTHHCLKRTAERFEQRMIRSSAIAYVPPEVTDALEDAAYHGAASGHS